MSRSFPSVDEVVSLIKKSNIPTLVTEGRDDYIVFRRIEDLMDGGVSVLPVGGRDAVIQVYRRRDEIGHRRVAFIVDRDLWSFSGVPNELLSDRLLVTDGYSIENDVFRDADVMSLMSNDERLQFFMDMQRVNRWYALAVSRNLAGGDARLDVHPNELLDLPGKFEEFTELLDGEVYPQDLFENVSIEAPKLLRGKTLFAVSMRQLARAGRAARHHHHAIMDIAAAKRGPLLGRITSEIELALGV